MLRVFARPTNTQLLTTPKIPYRVDIETMVVLLVSCLPFKIHVRFWLKIILFYFFLHLL